MDRRHLLHLTFLLNYLTTIMTRAHADQSKQSLQNSRVRSTSGKLLLYQPEYGFSGPTRGLESAAEWATPIIYMPPGLHTALYSSDRLFDHSDAGIMSAAVRTVTFLKEKFSKYNTSIAMFDIEKFKSTNSSFADYKTNSQDIDLSAVYSPLATASVRENAVRFQRILATTIYEMLEEQHVNAELGWYNIPRSPGWHQRSPEQILLQVNRTYDDAFQALIEPLAAFVGPSAQIIVTKEALTSYARKDLDSKSFIKWKVDTCLAYRKRFGQNTKIIPTIWPRWYITGHPRPSTLYPSGDVVVPPGFMRSLCSSLLDDAGVSGFMCWRASTDDDFDGSDDDVAGRLSERWGEVSEVVRSRSDFVSLY